MYCLFENVLNVLTYNGNALDELKHNSAGTKDLLSASARTDRFSV